jgi:hypothetical protein
VARAFAAAARRLLVVAALRPAARRFRVVAAFAPAARRFRMVAAFRAAALRFRVTAAFLAADFAMAPQCIASVDRFQTGWLRDRRWQRTVGYPASWSSAKYRFAQRIGLFDRNACAATLYARRASVRLTDFTIAS